jgi:hypothetical protein
MDDGRPGETTPLVTIEVKVHGRNVLAQASVGGDTEREVWADLGGTERRCATVRLLSAVLRAAMDFQSTENGLSDALHTELLQVLGRELFDLLLQGNVRQLVRQHLNEGRLRRERLRLTLSFDNDEIGQWLAGLPWEYMHAPEEDGSVRFLSTQTELMMSRRLQVEYRRLGEHATPIRVLLVCPSPTAPGTDEEGLRRVDPSTMLRTLRQLEADGFIELETLIDEDPPPPDQAPPEGYTWRATREAFAGLVTEFDPFLIHVVCHGRCSEGHGELALSRSNGKADWVRAQDFTALACESSTLRAVFLQACESALPDPYVGFSGVAQELANQGLPAVVAMQYRIAAPTADRFAKAFYEALQHDAAVDEAVKAGRDALRARAELREQLSFGLPVLYLSAYRAISRPQAGPPPIVLRPDSRRNGSTWHGVCANCNTPFATGASYCSHCGEALQLYCGRCGAFTPAEPAQYCPSCGSTLAQEPVRDDVALQASEPNAVVAEITQAFEGPGALR